MIFFHSKESKSEKNCFFFFGRGEGKEGLASVKEFVLQRIQILEKILFFGRGERRVRGGAE